MEREDIYWLSSVGWEDRARVGGKGARLGQLTRAGFRVPDGFILAAAAYERFLDENENNTRDSFEPIYDFNNNSTYDPADGAFNGVLCLDNTGRCSANITTGISSGGLIIMSGSVPATVSPVNGSTLSPAIPAGGTQTYSISFADLNNNPLPAGTTITGTVAGQGLSIGTPSTFTVPCTTNPTAYPFTVSKAPTNSGSGTLTVTVKTPAGLETLLSYAIQ